MLSLMSPLFIPLPRVSYSRLPSPRRLERMSLRPTRTPGGETGPTLLSEIWISLAPPSVRLKTSRKFFSFPFALYCFCLSFLFCTLFLLKRVRLLFKLFKRGLGVTDTPGRGSANNRTHYKYINRETRVKKKNILCFKHTYYDLLLSFK